MRELFINNEGPYDYEYDVFVDSIEVSSLGGRTPDADWYSVDLNGHFHTFSTDGDLPTLSARHNGEDMFIGYFCVLCGAYVEPSFKAGQLKMECIQKPPEVTIVAKKVPLLIASGTKVSFHTASHFGIASVTNTHSQLDMHCRNCKCPTLFDVTLFCEKIAVRNPNADLWSL